MKKLLFSLFIVFCLFGCKASKRTEVVVKKPKTKTSITKKVAYEKTVEKTVEFEDPVEENVKSNSLEDKIIDYAKTFQGVKYRFGGTTYSGIDCSGLVFETFRAHDILLPRISRDIAKQGDKIKLKDTKKGDLLFFKTGNKRNSINHVGIVTDIKDNNIYFIHSTSSQGVIISSLNEKYWLGTFDHVRTFL